MTQRTLALSLYNKPILNRRSNKMTKNPVPWGKEFRKNHAEDFRICCSKIYYKCKCRQKNGKGYGRTI